MAAGLSSSVQKLKGIGPKGAQALARMGIYTCRDLLYHYPRGYEDKTQIVPVEALSSEVAKVAEVTITSEVRKIRIRSGRIMVQAEAADDTGSLMLCFFNQEYMKNVLHRGEKYRIYGKISGGKFSRDMINPEVHRADDESFAGIQPLYPLTEGIRQNDLRKAVRQVLDEAVGGVAESLPNAVRQENGLCTAGFALENIHFPSDEQACAMARKRLVFGEFFTLSTALGLKKGLKQAQQTEKWDVSALDPFEKSLPFPLTGAQKRATEEILRDLSAGSVMNRLVQGDVGSGKTAVAAAAAFIAIQNGRQAAVMAPTEILAAQHDKTFRRFFAPFGIRTALLTSSTKTAEKREILEKLASNQLDFVAATHAILEENVVFHRLGLVICDEQHRFGVEQRTRLSAKGESVHTLVMSATPIPRTLALVMYGDLDVSVIDELPPGREKVATFSIGEGHRQRLYGFLRDTVKKGRQVYIVCPLIEENDELDLLSAESHAEQLRDEVFPDLRVALLHGKMKAKDKNEIMRAFAAHEADILVSTTVLEVGIDVPNATVMVVENAERFGLSQLHQLRGRVGRGGGKSYCFLLSDSTGTSAERLKVMTATNDGFKVAEADLELRGPGDFFGKRQSGLPEMRIASFSEDVRMLEAAQKAAEKLLAQDPDLSKEENRLLKRTVDRLIEKLEKNETNT